MQPSWATARLRLPLHQEHPVEACGHLEEGRRLQASSVWPVWVGVGNLLQDPDSLAGPLASATNWGTGRTMEGRNQGEHEPERSQVPGDFPASVSHPEALCVGRWGVFQNVQGPVVPISGSWEGPWLTGRAKWGPTDFVLWWAAWGLRGLPRDGQSGGTTPERGPME